MKLALCILILFSLLIRTKRKHNYLPLLILCPLSMSAQNGEIGGVSNSEIIFWFFVLGFLVSILPERKKPFEQKAMRVIKITILGVLVPLVCIGQSKDICEGRILPDFKTSVQWDITKMPHGAAETRLNLPLLDACHFGNYTTEWFFYDNGILYRYEQFPMICFNGLGGGFIDDDDRRRFSSSMMSHGDGFWFAKITGVDCGYIYSYRIVGNAFAWQMRKLECN